MSGNESQAQIPAETLAEIREWHGQVKAIDERPPVLPMGESGEQDMFTDLEASLATLLEREAELTSAGALRAALEELKKDIFGGPANVFYEKDPEPDSESEQYSWAVEYVRAEAVAKIDKLLAQLAA